MLKVLIVVVLVQMYFAQLISSEENMDCLTAGRFLLPLKY